MRSLRNSLPVSFFVAVVLTVLPPGASAYEGEVHRQVVDGGVHQPVLTKPPELKSSAQADYPPAALKEGLQGEVKMLVTLAADGSVAEVTVKEGAGHGFDEAAVAALKKFLFSPAEVDGVPAPIQLEYVYHFTLEDAPREAKELKKDEPPPPPPPGTLKGQVIARGSRTRVPAATVRCGDEADAPEVTTDEEGRFELRTAAGECQVRVIANGFKLYQQKQTVASNEIVEVVFYILPEAVGYETVVRGERDKKEVVRRTLERAEIQKVPGTFGDPVRVIQNLPGVARAPYLSGQLIVRGAAPDQTLTFFDGVEIPLLYHLAGGPSVVNAEFLNRVDFYPGGFGARYGRAVGGVVDVESRKGAVDTWHGSIKADFLDTGFFVEAPVAPGISVAAAARRSYVDVLLPLVLPKDPEGGSILVLPRYWDYQVRVDVGTPKSAQGPGGANSFYVMAFGSDDVLKVVATGGGLNRDVTVDVHTNFHRVKGDWTYRQGGITSVFAPYAGYDLGSGNFGFLSFKSSIYSLGAREDLKLEVAPFLTVRTGVDTYFAHLVGEAQLPVLSGVQYLGFPGAQPALETQSLNRYINSFDGAVFLETDLKLGPVSVTPGLRASYARVHGHDLNALDPRLWLRYQLAEGTALKGSLGLYSQPPGPADLEPAPFGTPTLVHEKAFQTSVGVEHKFSDVLSVDVTGYFNRRYDNIVSPGKTLQNADGSVTREQYANAGLGRAYGLEVLLRHDVTKEFFGWLAYTLNRSEARREGETTYLLTRYDQTHILTVVGSYRLPLGFELGARFRYVTGNPRTPLTHPSDLYQVDGNTYSPTRGEALSSRNPAFNQLDFRVDKNFVFQNWTLDVYLDIQNVYNAENTETYFNDYRFRQEVPVPGIPFLPVLGVKGSF